MSLEDSGFKFNDIIYRKPWKGKPKKVITDVIGFDTEAYSNGQPFLYCTALGDSFEYDEIPECLFSAKYRSRHFVVYNIRYEIGALTYNLPLDKKVILKDENTVIHNGFKYSVIPGKFIRIADGVHAVSFSDLQPFFRSSLDNAARKHLGERKLGLRTKKFTSKYVARFKNSIIKYCIRDAELTKKLGDLLLKSLNRYDIYPSDLYSPASVGFCYFKQQGKIIDVWHYWIRHRELLRMAWESYSGGKFEAYARGKFSGYIFDINSAYPYEMMNLIDITRARVSRTKKYQPAATYGLMRVYIPDMNDIFHPIAVKMKGVDMYPVGSFNATITKAEYLFLRKHKVEVRILDAYWLFADCKIYPYRKTILKLHKLKNQFAGKDDMMYNIAKLMLNSFYGKMCQKILDPKGRLRVSAAWNPVYAAIITANVRIRLSDIQNKLGRDCLAVHTDSIITSIKPDCLNMGENIGDWKEEKAGSGVIISTGIYQIGDKTADRGYKTIKGHSWLKTLKKMKHKAKITLNEIRVLTWRYAVRLGRPDEVNRFVRVNKVFDVNSEKKRIWPIQADAERILTETDYSIPKPLFQEPKKFKFKPYGYKVGS